MSNDANKLRQKQEIRKYLVFAGMFLLFVGCMWLIFARPKRNGRGRKGMPVSIPNCPTERGGYRGGQDYRLRAGGHETQAGREDAHAGGLLRACRREQAG